MPKGMGVDFPSADSSNLTEVQLRMRQEALQRQNAPIKEPANVPIPPTTAAASGCMEKSSAKEGMPTNRYTCVMKAPQKAHALEAIKSACALRA